jgi:TrpR family trp operon transcriptional repressor
MNQLSEVAKFLCSLKDSEKMEKVLSELLTASEQKALASRWALMELLEQSMSQREISAKLGISLCKITRGAKILKNQNSEIVKWLSKHNK